MKNHIHGWLDKALQIIGVCQSIYAWLHVHASHKKSH